ncbi:MAG: hypothetical protein BWY63_02084 [Chloroflexi bacterium ADurb.Bin360]|nr:MAG: hypothetical protein BWY63_02084 [Chloroflexi bacterium ADurb.Bin360]
MRRPAYVQEEEVGSFQQDIPGGIFHLTIQSSHHSTHANRPAAIGDQTHIAVEGAQFAIQSSHLLAGKSATHDDGRLAPSRTRSDLGIVEGMQGLT